MTKAATTAKGYTGTLAALPKVLAGQAKVIGQQLQHADPARRADAERRLRKAYAALRPKPWPTWLVQQEILKAIDRAIGFVERAQKVPGEGWTLQQATARATEEIAGTMDDVYAPAEIAGRRPADGLVRACLVAGRVRRGKPKDGIPAATNARLSLLTNLGVRTNAAAMRKAHARRAKRRA